MLLNAKQIVAYTGGSFIVDPIDPSALFTGITWDSREVMPHWLYVALPGQRCDGHEFVAAALRAGAGGALVTQAPDEKTRLLAREMGAAVIEVPNTASAITDLAREWRHALKGRVIGLTGSTGKTTTKNLIRDVVGAARSVVATAGNQNNELGVPRTLLAADPDTEVVIVEMGMRGSGQIAELCDFVRPDWGVITNVGESHIELLGSREAIAQAKGELLEALPKGTGQAFLNGTDDFSAYLAQRADLEGRSIVCTSYDAPNGELPKGPVLAARNVELDDEGRARFSMVAMGFPPLQSAVPVDESEPIEESVMCHLSLRGIHNVSNACAAAAVGRALGMSLPEIAGILSDVVPESGRQEILTARDGYTVINDAYNANPDSMRASLTMFAAMKVPGKRYAVLGDMGELGDFAGACHKGIGRLCAQLPIDRLIVVGELAQLIADAAIEDGMDERKIVRASSVGDVLCELDGSMESDDAVLIKASHFMGLTRVVEGLVS